MIGKFESNKDLIQELTTTGAKRIGNIAGIITNTVVEVTREIGEWITDAIEMNEAAAAAREDAAADRDVDRIPGDHAAEEPRTEPAQAVVDAEVVESVIEPESEQPR